MTTLEIPEPSSHLSPSPIPLKHSIDSLLNPKKTLKQAPVRPSPRYRPYSLPDTPPSSSISTSPPPSSITPLEQHLILLKQLQQRMQLSNYIATHEQTGTLPPHHIPTPSPRSKPILTPTLPSSNPPPNLHPAPGSMRKRRSAVVTSSTSPHSCTATTCTSISCPHRITTSTPPTRKLTRSAETRYRTNLTSEQKDKLQMVFSETIYLTRVRRRLLSEETGLKEDIIAVWFQNRRRLMKKKQENTPRL